MLGVETDAPVLTDVVREQNLTNEGGVGGTNRLLKNIAGMWILESCRRAWAAQGRSLSLEGLDHALAAAPARRAFVLPDAPRFFNPPDMPAALTLSGRVKTGHLWTPQIRPFPAPETSVDLYLTASCVRKLVWTLVRQLRGPHLRMWA